MKKYRLEITRATRAECPTEAWLEPDNIIDVNGTMMPAYLTQDPTKDSFVTFYCESLSLVMHKLQQLEKRSPLASGALDGIKVLAHPAGGGTGNMRVDTNVIPAYTDIDGSDVAEETQYAQIQVQWQKEDDQ